MKIFKIISLILFLLIIVLPVYSQQNSVVPNRTPEQEASKQTEKIQQELNLNQEQTNKVYEINLRYARERQMSNNRGEALERMKNKNAEIKQVLSPEQNERLQTKRYERTYLETNTLNQNQSFNSSNNRPATNFRPGQNTRIPSPSDANVRNNYRPVNPNFHPRTLPYQTSKRTTNTAPPSYQYRNNPNSPRSSGSSPNNIRRAERPVIQNRK
jgi:Na+-transporting methylmalonyl-CoA/oxaloacetate decarboxylase gamma subunit